MGNTEIPSKPDSKNNLKSKLSVEKEKAKDDKIKMETEPPGLITTQGEIAS